MDTDNQSATKLGTVNRIMTADDWEKMDSWEDAARNRKACLRLVHHGQSIDVYELPGIYKRPPKKRMYCAVRTTKAVA